MAKKAKTGEHTETITMTFVGLRWNPRTEKREYNWMECSGRGAKLPVYDDENTIRVWGKSIQRGATPGAVYEFKCARTGEHGLSVTLESGNYKGTLADEDRVVQWQIQHKGATQHADAQGRAKRELKKRLDLARLEPLRVAYMHARRAERPHILAEIIRAVTSQHSLG